MSVNSLEEHVSHEWSCVVHMYTLPWGVGPDPWVQWSSWRVRLDGLAGFTGLSEVLYFFVEAVPPKVTACCSLHSRYAGVCLVKCLECGRL